MEARTSTALLTALIASRVELNAMLLLLVVVAPLVGVAKPPLPPGPPAEVSVDT